MKFQVFGSSSSQDYDIIVFIDSLKSTIKENDILVKYYEEQLSSIFTDKPLNVNLGVLHNHKLISSYKGTVDEVNNACYFTYSLHKQIHPQYILQLVERDVYLKVSRTIRVLLSMISRTNYRTIVKKALISNNITERFNCLKLIEYNTINGFGKNLNVKDIFKVLSFQLGQTIGLLNGVELYTKESINEYFPELNSFLYRQDTLDMIILNKYLKYFLTLIENKLELIPNEILRK